MENRLLVYWVDSLDTFRYLTFCFQMEAFDRFRLLPSLFECKLVIAEELIEVTASSGFYMEQAKFSSEVVKKDKCNFNCPGKLLFSKFLIAT